VELLVVIAIVAILVSLVLPGLARRNQRPEVPNAATTCANGDRPGNLRSRERRSHSAPWQGVQQLFIVDRSEDWFNALPASIHQPTYLDLLLAGKSPQSTENNFFVCPAAKPTGHTNFLLMR